MISVPSHHLQLSGSRILLFFLLAQLFFSCTAKKVVKGKGELPTVETALDTIQWAKDEYGAPPIKSDEVDFEIGKKEEEVVPIEDNSIPSSEKYSSYKVSMLFPFYAGQSGKSSKDKSLRAINLYGGMKMATDDLQRDNIFMSIDVHDSNGDPSTTQTLMNSSSFSDADLIFGPFRRENIEFAADLSKYAKTPIVSPMNPSNSVAKENPYYIQVKPGLETHCAAITKHILDNFNPEDVILVSRNKSAEKARFKFFNDAKSAHTKGANTEDFEEYVISDYSNNFNNMDFFHFFPKVTEEMEELPEAITKIFVLPSWSSEAFIANALRLIRLAKQHHNVYVYGMPQWKSYEKVDFEYYEALNLYVSSDGFVDPTLMETKDFKRNYFNKYAALPTEDAYFGYDLMQYFATMLNKHGSQFQTKIDLEPYQGIHTSFDFQAVMNPGNVETETIEYYENKHVDILKFENFYFQSAEN